MKYLLDTNVCVSLINGTSDQVRSSYAQAARGNALLATSSIVVHELWYGVAKSSLVTQNAWKLTEFLRRDLSVFDYSSQDARGGRNSG